MVIISSYQIKLVEIHMFWPAHGLELGGQAFMPKHSYDLFFFFN